MLKQIALGGAVSLLNIAIHALIVAWIILAARRAAVATMAQRPLRRLIVVTGSTAAALMAGHVVEVGVWAVTYALAGVAQTTHPLYFAFVNYTTLGYGDVVPADEWRLIGPITAMNGVLLFGLSTAVLFDVLRTLGASLEPTAPKVD
jgi:hypothetical protein